MKKLNRKSLDELARKLPVINESEQRQLIGGIRYYDGSGNFIGKFGSSDNIMITVASEAMISEAYASSGMANEYDNFIYNSSMSYSETPEVTKVAVFNSILNELESGVGVTGTVGIVDGAKFDSESNKICVDFAHIYFQEGNYYNIKTILSRELYSGTILTDYSEQYRLEYEAYYQQIYSPDFENLTSVLKAALINNFNYYATLLGEDTYENN